MPSFGEEEIVVDSYRVGKVRIGGAYAGGALYPRLCLSISVALRPMPSGGASGQELPLEITDLTGELRVGQPPQTVGTLLWTGDRRAIESSSTGSETQVVCCCDLDH